MPNDTYLELVRRIHIPVQLHSSRTLDAIAAAQVIPAIAAYDRAGVLGFPLSVDRCRIFADERFDAHTT